MKPSAEHVRELVEAEVTRIHDPVVLARLRAFLVEPYPVERAWDYGAADESYVCWTVLEHRASNTGIAYCDGGFGPADPWGLVFLSGPHMNIGMDAGWYEHLEEAFKESMAWDGDTAAADAKG